MVAKSAGTTFQSFRDVTQRCEKRIEKRLVSKDQGFWDGLRVNRPR